MGTSARGRGRRVVALTVLGMVLFGPVAGALAQPAAAPLPWTDKLDESTTSYLYRMGWEEMKGLLKDTTPLAVIEDPAVQAFIKDFQRLGKRGDPYGPAFTFLLSALHKELVLSATPQKAAAQPAADQAAHPPRPTRLLVARSGPAGAAEFARQYDAALAALKKADALADLKTVQIDQMSFNSAGEGLHFAMRDGSFYWLLTAEDAKPALPSGGAKPLAQSPMFQQVVGQLAEGVKGKPVALFYHDLRPSWKELTGGEGGAAWGKLSWRSLDAVGGATFIEGKGYRNRYCWKVGAERTGLFKHTQKGRVNAEWLKRVSADATGFVTGYWDGVSFVNSLPALAIRLAGEEPAELAQMGETLKPVTDLFGTLGPRYLIYRQPGRYGSFPVANAIPLEGTVLVAELADRDKFDRALDQFFKQLGGDEFPVQRITVSGRPVRAINLMFLTIYIAQLDREVVVVSNAQLLKDVLENWAKPGPSIVETEPYKAAKGPGLAAESCFQLYISPGGLARGFYDQYIPMAQQGLSMLAGGFGMFGGGEGPKAPPAARGLDPMLFPRGRDFARHITEPTILSARDDGQAVIFDGHAPLLRTPYYWVYLYAFGKMNPGDMEQLGQFFQYLFMPAEVGEGKGPEPGGKPVPVPDPNVPAP